MGKETKTNACRILDKAKISYEEREYPVDENDLSGVHVAEVLGVPPESMYKTLVLKGDKTGYLVILIPVAEELDLKKCAKLSGNKKVEMLPMKDLLGITGYIRGGCSPVGMKKPFPTFVQEEARERESFIISAGRRGAQLVLSPKELVSFLRGEFADCIQK